MLKRFLLVCIYMLHACAIGGKKNRYAVVAAVVGMAGSLLQTPVAVYLLCRGKRMMTPSSLILDVSMYADIVRALDRTAIP